MTGRAWAWAPSWKRRETRELALPAVTEVVPGGGFHRKSQQHSDAQGFDGGLLLVGLGISGRQCLLRQPMLGPVKPGGEM